MRPLIDLLQLACQFSGLHSCRSGDAVDIITDQATHQEASSVTVITTQPEAIASIIAIGIPSLWIEGKLQQEYICLV